MLLLISPLFLLSLSLAVLSVLAQKHTIDENTSRSGSGINRKSTLFFWSPYRHAGGA